MTDAEILERAILNFHGHERLRFLVSADHPEAAHNWRMVRRLAGLTPEPRQEDLPRLDEHEFVTTARLAVDAASLVAILPPDLDCVVGIARSGVLPASVLAYALHVPLYSVHRERGLLDLGRGTRFHGRLDVAAPRHALVIDDTAYHGTEMRACLPIVRKALHASRITSAVVYAHPNGIGAVDLCGFYYPGPHWLEWNWSNSAHSEGCAFDFDGILCHDCPAPDDDDGPRYRRFLEFAKPFFLPRRRPARLIVTARHERYRALTESWLIRHGVRWERLVMRDFEYDRGRLFHEQVGAYKASYYAASDCHLMAESDPAQAELIAVLAGRRVLCPAAGRLIPPPAPVAPVPAWPSMPAPSGCRSCL